ncbi:flavin reductase [Spirochaetia bacterium]|nr:flavin reductase [Spirochaetia bacterium]
MKQKEAIPAGDGWTGKTIREFQGNTAERIGNGWMLITAADVSSDRGNWNTMTASWGGLGVLWGRDVVFMFIRPSRHTYHFANTAPLFTLSFFEPAMKGALDLCGSKSGRDIDKAAAAGLSPIVFEEGPAAGAVGFKEATEIILCRKLYTHDFDPHKFLDAPSIEKNYNGQDYHRMFIGEVISLMVKK